MIEALQSLSLSRCSYCGVSSPYISGTNWFSTRAENLSLRYWGTYCCSKCGGTYLVEYESDDDRSVINLFPETKEVNDVIPPYAREYLSQALDTLHAPSGSLMLSASSVDAMLKAKGYREGSLYSRINKAADDHLITKEMAQWAHQVRLDANEQRHSDENYPLPNYDDAKLCLNFALALAEFLFVLPSKVSKGIKDTTDK